MNWFKFYLIFFSCISVGTTAQDSLQANEVLDLRELHSYPFELELADGSSLYFSAAALDWELAIHEAAATLDLKKILLPNKEILASYALTLRVLQRQPESTFYNRPTTYSKFLTPFLSEEENKYLQEQLVRMDSIYKSGNSIQMGLAYLQQTGKVRNYALLADSLIARAYALPLSDASDFEAVLRARWSRQASNQGDFRTAIQQQKQVYQIRKERKDWLSYSIVPLARLYESSGQWEALLELYRDGLKEMSANEYPAGPKSYYNIWNMIAYMAEYGDLDEAIQYFEHWAPLIAETELPVWSTPNWIPYTFAIRASEDGFEALAYAERWVAALRQHGGTQINQADIVPLLEALKPFAFDHKSVADYMQSVFEEFYFPANRDLNWKKGHEKYWFWVVPYQRVLMHQKPDEQLPTLQRWMTLALYTENYEIIRETAFHVAYGLAKIGQMEMADSLFVQHYCGNLLKRSNDNQAWFQASPYSLASGDKADFWYNRWIALAREHASTNMQTSILRFVARKYFDRERYAASAVFHEEVLALYQQERDLRGQERSLSHLLWLQRDMLKNPIATTQYTIQLYDCQFNYYRLIGYKIYETYLESAFALLKRLDKIARKDKKQILSLWKNWAATLDESDVDQLRIKKNLKNLMGFLDW